MATFFEFIMSETFKYADINIFSQNLGQALRYYDFLLIILDRYKEVNDKIVSLHEEERKRLSTQQFGIRQMTPEDIHQIEESGHLTNLLHLEIESFYVFAKVFLDNIARFLYIYFGDARNIKKRSHSVFTNNHKEYFEIKGLVTPKGISESIIFLRDNICNYRDKVISHEEPLGGIKATMWGASRDARIIGGRVFPKEGEKKTMTRELPELIEAINVYIQQVIALIESNRAKTTLKLRDETS